MTPATILRWTCLISLSTAVLLIGQTIFQSCGGVESRPRAPFECGASKHSLGNPKAETQLRTQRPVDSSRGCLLDKNPSRTSDRPARLETLPRVHLRETKPDLRPVESPEITTI